MQHSIIFFDMTRIYNSSQFTAFRFLISSLPSPSMFYFMIPAGISFHISIMLSYLIIVKQRSSLGGWFIIANYRLLFVIIFIFNDRQQPK